VDLTIARGRVLGVIGPNGAGKTTLIDAITGFAAPDAGTVRVEGRQLNGFGPRRRARRGLGRTFQNLELSEDLTVEENILSAVDRGRIDAYLTDLFWPRRPRLNARSTELVRLLGLEDDLQTIASDLPNGRRRLVAVARMAVREPAVMCLDEPAAGLSAAERLEFSRVLRLLADEFEAAVLLVEHNIDVVAESCDDLLALDFGRPIAGGTTVDVLASDAVRRAYLGETVEADGLERSHDPAPEALVPLGNAGEEA
jgi:sulfate-transporting ATPase